MQLSKRRTVALLSSAALAGSAVGGVNAFGDHGGQGGHGRHGGQTLFASKVVASQLSDPMIHGVTRGGLPWVMDRGEARLRRNGRLQVRVRGLVIPVPQGDGTPGPVTTITAALYCGDDTTAAAETAPIPLSRTGNARIDERITLPSTCLAPVVLVHPNGSDGAYIAVTGFGR
jgi:hypothetical protein